MQIRKIELGDYTDEVRKIVTSTKKEEYKTALIEASEKDLKTAKSIMEDEKDKKTRLKDVDNELKRRVRTDTGFEKLGTYGPQFKEEWEQMREVARKIKRRKKRK